MHELKMPQNYQTVVERFTHACQADDRIVAAFLGGSYARGAADEYSDLDLYMILKDEDYDDFKRNCDAFLQLLGEPIFNENFGIPNIIFYFFADGTVGELWFSPESDFHNIHSGPYATLVDKKDILTDVVFAQIEPDPVTQTETLRQLVFWFWHDLSHFIAAMGRGQLWWAQGQLEELRRYCVNLARLQHNFLDPSAGGDEPYFKIEREMPVEQLSALKETFCPMEPEAMLKASVVLVQVYNGLARSLAQAHGIAYPDVLERMLVDQLEILQKKLTMP